jgi:class 3 adenylate cyclase
MPELASPNPAYRFQHDRVQQAAYALIDREERQAVHLSIGRFVLQHCSPQQLDEQLIEIVGHLNAGRALLNDAAERTRVARMNLDAGLKAVRSSAYDSALGFLRIGVELLGREPWEADYDLMLALARETQQCAYLTGAYDEADEWTETTLQRARTPLVKGEILSARTRQYATMGRMRESIEAALLGLAVLGYEVTANPTAQDLAHLMEAVEKNLAGREIAALLDEPQIADPGVRVAVRLLMEVFAAAFLSGTGDLFPYLILTGVNLSLRNGTGPESAFSYAAYGMLLCGSLNDTAKGYEYGKLAVAMNERFNDIALKSRIIYVYAMFIHHWSNHWSSMTPWFHKGIEAGYQSGDLLYLAYSAQDCILWDPKLDLATASQEQRKYLEIVKDCDYRDSYDSGTLFLRMQLNFQGLTSDTFSMNDAAFDEAACVEGMRQRRFMTGIANYHIYKAEIHALYGDHAGALEHVEAQDRLVASAMSLPQLVRFCIVAFLTRAALYPRIAPASRAATLQRLQSDLRQMSAWAANCKDNFEHLRLMMEGELARLDGAMPKALALYERAIAAAHASGFLRDEATANELTARYLLALELPRAADGYLREARYLFDRWGARRKVEQLEREYPRLRQAAPRALAGYMGGTQTAILDSGSLDISSVMKASQTISGEIFVDRLVNTTLQLLLENAGGRKACFAVQEDNGLVVRARIDVAPDAVPLQLPLRLSAQADRVLPLSVVNNALRTGVPLVLNDPAQSGRFASDPYIVATRPLSAMCVPIQQHGRFSGAIYLENGLTAGAFSQERVEVIKLLAAQAAISLENASRHEDQVRLIAAQSRFVPSRFLQSLGHSDIARVGLGEFVALEMGVMFADLRSFTPLAERLGPRSTIELLNRYFTRMSGPISDGGGFIDSYNGDEVMALFPLPADCAVRAGVAMYRALDDFNAEAAGASGPLLRMGVGINTGPLVLGTVGSADRLKCGVVGDTVNTASRIEQLTKRYAAPLLIGEHTFASLLEPEQFSMRLIDRVAAKGKELAISIYEVLDAESPQRRRAKESTRELLAQALALYFAGDFAAARDLLDQGRAMDPADQVLAVLSQRCAHYAAKPPAAWKGVEQFDEK